MTPFAPLAIPTITKYWRPTTTQEIEILAAIQPVLDEYGVTLAAVRGPRRTPFLVRARHACYVAAYEAVEASSTELGRFFNRDHANILYAVRKASPTEN